MSTYNCQQNERNEKMRMDLLMNDSLEVSFRFKQVFKQFTFQEHAPQILLFAKINKKFVNNKKDLSVEFFKTEIL